MWNLNKLLYNLHRFLDFASTRILPKTCPALNWDEALPFSSWVNRFQTGKANWKVAHLVHYLCTWIDLSLITFQWEKRTRLGSVGWTISYKSLYFVHPSLELVPLLTGMRERSITCASESHHLHVHSRDYCDIRRTLNSTPGPTRPHIIHAMHISRCNTGMWTDREKIRLYS